MWLTMSINLWTVLNQYLKLELSPSLIHTQNQWVRDKNILTDSGKSQFNVNFNSDQIMI